MINVRDIGKYWFLIAALAAYGVLAYLLNFTQDDAYISYRYVANYLNGDGLVFNIGQRVEGITNFGWTTIMIMIGSLGGDYIWWSKLLGALFGAGIVFLTFLIGQELFGEKELRFTGLATLLVGVNQSLAYWSPAGLETAAFGFFAMLAFLWYLRRSYLLIFALVMAVWLRPEGAVVTGLLIVTEAVQNRRLPLFSAACAAVALVLSFPFVGFKLAYYGSILPNPFYAKTSFNADQFANGIEYAGLFFKHYGFYYVGLAAFLVPVLVWKRLNAAQQTVAMFVAMYTAYIILIGGDVLKVHRFFIPLVGGWALLVAITLRTALNRVALRTQHLLLVLIGLVMVAATYELPKAFVEQYNEGERAFTHKMASKAKDLKESDPRPFSVAVATIGIFGYDLLGHDIIDMVGLTDSTIARYSEPPIPGMQTTWKEQKHNTKYLLERQPDYIMFSTGIKPSAPAERALLLYRQFIECYRTVGWYYQRGSGTQGVISSVFKRIKPVEGELVPYYAVEYVQEYKSALDAYSAGDHKTALQHYEAAVRASAKPYNPYLLYQMAFSLQMLGQYEKAFATYETLVAQDSMIFEPHLELYRKAAFNRDSAGMALHRAALLRLVPWYWPRFERAVQESLRRQR